MIILTRIECNHGGIVYLWFDDGTERRQSYGHWAPARKAAWKLATEYNLAPRDIKGGVVVVWGK